MYTKLDFQDSKRHLTMSAAGRQGAFVTRCLALSIDAKVSDATPCKTYNGIHIKLKIASY